MAVAVGCYHSTAAELRSRGEKEQTQSGVNNLLPIKAAICGKRISLAEACALSLLLSYLHPLTYLLAANNVSNVSALNKKQS